MARRFTTGFELGEIIEHNGSLSYYLANFSVVTSPVRTGSYAARNDAGQQTSIADSFAYFSHILSDNPQELYVRLALRHSGYASNLTRRHCFLAFMDSTSYQLSLGIKPSTQVLSLARGGTGVMGYNGTVLAEGTAVLTANTWYVIEVYVKIANTGACIVKINGVTDINFSGDTAETSNEYCNKVLIGANWLGSPDGAILYFDDIAINDTSGTYQNSWIGQGGVYLLKPNGDGAVVQWTRSGGTTNYENVDEIPKNTTDWVQGQNSNTKDLYTLEDLPADVKVVDLVEPVWQAALSQAGWNSIKGVIRPGTTDYADAAAKEVTSVHPNYVLYKGDVRYVNPDTGLAWTPAQVNGMQAGILIP